jgi:acyl-CoA dehydrogenase
MYDYNVGCSRLMSDGVELFGAVGVMHNHVSTLFRDSTVLPIWEGTSNTIALDLLRIAHREPECISALHSSLTSMTQQAPSTTTTPNLREGLQQNLTQVFNFLNTATKDPASFEWNTRRAGMNLSRLFIACVACRTASATGHVDDVMLAEHWSTRVKREFEPFTEPAKMAAMRSALSSEIQGAGKDRRGKHRAYL